MIAVEPDSSLHPLINWNAPRATRVQAAVAAESGTATLWRVAASTQVSSLDRAAADEFGSAEPIDVETVTLTDLAERFGAADVIKLDIQGQESAAVEQGWEVVREARVLLVEVALLDRRVDLLLRRLRDEFGLPELVNDVYAGADLAYVRPS